MQIVVGHEYNRALTRAEGPLVPLGNYNWYAGNGQINHEDVDDYSIQSYGLTPPGATATTLVRSMFTASAGLSLSPVEDNHIAGSVAECVQVRACLWAVPGSTHPPISIVDPFVPAHLGDYVLAWAELLPSSVVFGFNGSFCMKYGIPGGMVRSGSQRLIGEGLQLGVTIRIHDPGGWWPRGAAEAEVSWSGYSGGKWLTGQHI